MATFRDNPYGAFNFLVSLGDTQGDGSEGTIVGGFSDVSGLGFDVTYSDYRNGNERINTARHIPNTYKTDEVTLKRGIVGSTDLFAWLKLVRDGDLKAAPPRTVTITLLDEARNSVATFTLRDAQPKKYTMGPLASKGGGEVAMEELHLVHTGLEYK